MKHLINKSWDPVWETVFSAQEWGRYPSEHVIRFVARRWYRIKDRSSIRILDLGCGPGACTWYVAREGFAASGIDGSPTAIAQAEKRLTAEGLRADLRVGDFVSLPWPDGYFDGVIDNATLCCNPFTSCLQVRDEVVRVLCPGGHFMSCNFAHDTWGTAGATPCGENEYSNLKQGPLAGKGFTLAMDLPQIERLYQPFTAKTVEQITWSAESMSRVTKLWLVEAVK